MRHGIRHHKLGRNTKSRKALLVSLAQSLLKHEQVRTTLVKAKAVRPIVEKLITLARDVSLKSRRRVAAYIPDPEVQKKLFADLGAYYEKRPGGYTRILKLGHRFGDNAPIAFLELVDREMVKTVDSSELLSDKK